MKSWGSARLGDLFILQMGKTPDRKNSLYWKNGINPWISISDITKCEKYIIDTKETITDQAVKECQIKAVPENVVLMSFKLSVGKVAITTKLTYTNEAIIAFLPIDENIILNDFLWYSLQVQNWNIGGNKAVKGITLNKKFLNEKIIKYPSLEEQKWIVSILEKVRQLIYFQKKRLEELDNLVQSVFYEMFGDPVKNEKEWREVKLGKICKLKAGNFVKASNIYLERKNNLFPCYGGNGLRGYTITYTHEGLYVLIGRQGALCGNVKLVNGKFHATEHAIVVSPLLNINTVWLFHIFGQLNLNKYATGAAQPGLSVTTLLDIGIPFPPLSLQTRFAAIVEKIEQQKALVKKALQESEDLFQRLMQDLFRPEQENGK